MITVGSVCSGYGGLEMGLASWLAQEGCAPPEVRWHAEVDPDASRVLKTWWPEVPNLGDFTVPDFSVERVDAECGGVPCQGFSSAGRQLGTADPRHLWPDWRRGIAARRPATVVFENVANLTRGKMRPIFDSIIADLLALGYDVRWCLLGACAVGAAHHRHRVFLLACRTRTTPNAAEVKVQTCGQHAAAYLPSPMHGDGEWSSRHYNNRGVPASMAAVDLLFPTTAARDADSRGEGDEAYWAARATERTNGMPPGAALALLPTPQHREGDSSGMPGAILAGARMPSGRRNLDDAIALLPSPRAIDAVRGRAAHDRNETLGRTNGLDLIQAVGPERWGKYAEVVARHEAVLGRPAPAPTEIGPKGGRRLAAAFSEWLMMLPEGHLTSVLDRNPALARAGNGVVPPQAATALRLLFDDLTGRR